MAPLGWNQIVCALRFFFTASRIGEAAVGERITYARVTAQAADRVLSADEVVRFLQAGRFESWRGRATLTDSLCTAGCTGPRRSWGFGSRMSIATSVASF